MDHTNNSVISMYPTVLYTYVAYHIAVVLEYFWL